MREQRHTWLVGKVKACRRKPKEGGAAAAPSYVHHNDSLRNEKCQELEVRRKKKYNEMHKSVKEGKVSPFISPRKIKSKPFD